MLKALHISFPGWNLFIQASIPVVQVRPQGIALLFPKQVAGCIKDIISSRHRQQNTRPRPCQVVTEFLSGDHIYQRF